MRFDKDFLFWMKHYKKRQLVTFKDSRGAFHLREFAVGLVVNASPRISRTVREAMLNEASKGQYQYTKALYERSGSPVLREQLKLLQRIHGISLSGGNARHRTIYLHHDCGSYETVEAKSIAWRKHCHKVCSDVLRQRHDVFQFWKHLEFAYLKYPEEPYENNNWISEEPIHEGEVGDETTSSFHDVQRSKAKIAWIDRIRKKYKPLFSAMRQGQGRHGKKLMHRYEEQIHVRS